jgi:hypothetical protein
MRSATFSPFALCVGLVLLLFAPLPPTLTAQVQPPAGSTLDDYFCWKARVCNGIAIQGQCQGQGFVCVNVDETCGQTWGGCSWHYVWACYESCGEQCTHVQIQEIGWDCGPNCDWIFYNDCACACENLGPGTVEAGSYAQCVTQ